MFQHANTPCPPELWFDTTATISWRLMGPEAELTIVIIKPIAAFKLANKPRAIGAVKNASHFTQFTPYPNFATLRLSGNTPVRPGHRLANRFCIRCVILHVSRRHQLHGVPKLCQFAHPIMRCRAGFHPDQTRV